MPIVDLFCGCGGLSKGFEEENFDILAAYDIWAPALTCYNANFIHPAFQLDLNDVDLASKEIKKYNPTIIIGGPPCQEFSNAGKRTEGALANLTFKYAQIVTTVLPIYFVMENVPGVQRSKAYEKARSLYKKSGYGLTEIVIDASRCNVPQKRNRFFCIGSLNDRDGFLQETIFENYVGSPLTVRQYFAQHNLPLDIDAYYRHPTTYKRRAVFSVDEVAPTIRGINRPMPATYRHHKNDAVQDDRMHDIFQLNTQQRAYIQTFPENFQLDGLGISQGDLEKLIGNAVPVSLARFVAAQLREYIGKRGDNAMEDTYSFSEWLKAEKHYTDRSISDVYSRIKRAERILPRHALDQYFYADLSRTQQFKDLTTSVRSQIKKAINLKLSYYEFVQHR